MSILITGGCGYVGSALVEYLISKKNKLKVIDNQLFGNYLKTHPNLKIIKKDVRKLNLNDLKGVKSVVHLANIANDPSVELNQELSWEVNVLASKTIMDLCVKAKIKKFIFASSGSVYGVSKVSQVTEDIDLLPISIYNKTKMISERVLLSYKKFFKIYCIRPATVCGYSPRMRLDLTVNMLTMQALRKGEITVFGGKQIRPNVHINDIVKAYEFFLKNTVPDGVYNIGFENLSIIQIAKRIKKYVDCKIKITKSNDRRSYRLNSQKLLSLGFRPKFGIDDAIKEIINLYNLKALKDLNISYNIKWMKKKKYK